MYIKKSVLAVFLVCAVAVGFGACALVETLSTDGSLLSGDIAKADLYSGQKVDPDVAVVEERLQNDTAFLHQTQDAMALLKQRLDTLNDLTDRTMSLCADVAEFKGVMSGISSLQVKAHNASLALDRTAEELEKVADGKRSNLYEQASNNAFIGFMKTESQLAIGKEFVETATKYIDKNGEKVSEDLARLVADWTVYCTEDAMINGSEDETAYWLSSAEKLDGVFSNAGNFGLAMKPVKKLVAAKMVVEGASVLRKENSGSNSSNNGSRFTGQIDDPFKAISTNKDNVQKDFINGARFSSQTLRKTIPISMTVIFPILVQPDITLSAKFNDKGIIAPSKTQSATTKMQITSKPRRSKGVQ